MALPTTGNRVVRRYVPELSEEMGRFFDQFLTTPRNRWEGWSPPANVVETEDAYTVEMDLPGYDRDDIEVTLEQGILSVRGQRNEETEFDRGTYHLRERSVGTFSRSFSLPRSVDASGLEAVLENGVLSVSLPKAAEAKARKIEVNVK
jgi:HSP20 family protein